MARKRMIDPSFWSDEKVGGLSPRARLAFIAMWNFAEDSGVGRAHLVYLRNTIFPYDDISAAEFEEVFAEIERSGMIETYEYDGQKYYQILHFKKHQQLSRPTACKLPLKDGSSGDTVTGRAKILHVDAEHLHADDKTTACSIEKNRIESNLTQEKRIAYGSRRNVFLTPSQYERLSTELGKAKADNLIEEMSLYLVSSGRKYADHFATLQLWDKREKGPPDERAKEWAELERAAFLNVGEDVL